LHFYCFFITHKQKVRASSSMAGGGIALVGMVLVSLFSGLFS
jgi:hypothetical protein